MGCIGCGEIFVNTNRQNLCANCLEKYDKVKKCLNRHSNVTIKELVELLDNEISVNFIKRLIDVELIEVNQIIQENKSNSAEEKRKKFVEELKKNSVVPTENNTNVSKNGSLSKNRKSVVRDILERE